MSNVRQGDSWKFPGQRGNGAEERGVQAMDKPDVAALKLKLAYLQQQHRDLDIAIATLEDSGTGDQLQLRRLKKMKLQLKDQMTKIEDELIPDIIA